MTIARSEWYDRGFTESQQGRAKRDKLEPLDQEDYDEGWFDGTYEANRAGGNFRQGRTGDQPIFQDPSAEVSSEPDSEIITPEQEHGEP